VYDAVIANGVVYVDEDAVAGEGTLRALDAATGAELATLPGHVGPVISHGVVYTVDDHFNDDGVPTLYALKP
jgi:outer membrane protein assembly factor BamB